MTTGERIRAARKMRKLTQKELAKMTGYGVATIQRYEYDEREPGLQELRKIGKALAVPVYELIDFGPDMIPGTAFVIEQTKNKRKGLRITQKMLAEKAGMKPQQLHDYEKGVHEPNNEQLRRILIALESLKAEIKKMEGV